MYKEDDLGVYVFPGMTRFETTYVITNICYNSIMNSENFFDLYRKIIGSYFNIENCYSWYVAKKMNPTYNKDWYKCLK